MERMMRSFYNFIRFLVLLVAWLKYGVVVPVTNAFTVHSASSWAARSSTLSTGALQQQPLVSKASSEVSYFTSRRTRRPAPSATSTALRIGLWDRLEIEEDEEPYWYLINCVATNELSLLEQCRQVCADFSEKDVVKFIVPTERKTRSHGAKKMVTETKVKYPGYVFAKLRLCKPVYEAIQGLDLCRSWMGTVNHKGHRKLPPAPVALSDDEIETFGLEEWEDEEEVDEDEVDEDNVLLDEAANDEDGGGKKEKYDKKALKVYLGLKVDDMVKVTAKGNFFNEDGIVRRLKDGKLFIRFYTYGSLFEEWFDPKDVRKLDNMEILMGLSGPSQPVTQRDFDDPGGRGGRGGYDRGGRGGRGGRGPDLYSNFGGPQQRNRRQDRTEQRFRNTRDNTDFEEEYRNQRNWDWYKENRQQPQPQQRQQQWDRPPRQSGRGGGQWDRPPPQRRQERNDGAWGGGSQQQQRQQQWDRTPRRQNDDDWSDRTPRRQNDDDWSDNRRDNRRDNQQADKAIRGEDDWSAFVSPSTGAGVGGAGGGGKKGGDKDEDDFFQSLLNDLSDDLQRQQGGNQPSQQRQQRPQQRQMDTRDSQSAYSGSSDRDPVKDDSSSEDDFFASLLSEVNANENKPRPQPSTRSSSSERPVMGSTQPSSDENDFFDSLLSEVSDDVEEPSSPPPPKRTSSPEMATTSSDDDDDGFFDSLLSQVEDDVAEPAFSEQPPLSPPQKSSQPPRQSRDKIVEEDQYNDAYADELFAELTADAPTSAPQKQQPSRADDEDDFFDNLQADLWSLDSDDGADDWSAPAKASKPSKAPAPFFAATEAVETKPAEAAATVEATEASTTTIAAPPSKAAAAATPAKEQKVEPPVPVAEEHKAAKKASHGDGEKGALTFNALSKQTVPVLKEMCRDRGLKVGGRKAELIERLQHKS